VFVSASSKHKTLWKCRKCFLFCGSLGKKATGIAFFLAELLRNLSNRAIAEARRLNSRNATMQFFAYHENGENEMRVSAGYPGKSTHPPSPSPNPFS
jgi:hypothetical protein